MYGSNVEKSRIVFPTVGLSRHDTKFDKSPLFRLSKLPFQQLLLDDDLFHFIDTSFQVNNLSIIIRKHDSKYCQIKLDLLGFAKLFDLIKIFCILMKIR
ncbi:MAG TPA: hypothetical protein DC013_11045 [Ruminococcaceae bacterium]|nr:hypothetical protein [Oscillospiraceae bacterium]